MTKEQKNEVIELLKGKFSQYNNFYVTDTESLTVEQVGKLRRACFNKQVEMKVAKNTLIKKALESLDSEKYAGMYESLHKVTALLFSENPKEPAMIISSFRCSRLPSACFQLCCSMLRSKQKQLQLSNHVFYFLNIGPSLTDLFSTKFF